MTTFDSQPSKLDLLDFIKSTDLFIELDDEALEELASDLEHVVLRDGQVLFGQNEPSDALYIVSSGWLQVVVTQPDGSILNMDRIEQGQPVGEMQILAGGNRTASVYALCHSELVKVPKFAFERLAQRDPKTLLRTAEVIRQRLRRHQLTFALTDLFGPLNEAVRQDVETHAEWVHLRRGQTLFRRGDPGDSLYIIVSGRLQAVVEDYEGQERVVAELVRGEMVGEMAVFTGEDRSASIYATHDSVLIKFSKKAVDRVVAQYPQVMSYVTRIVIGRLRQHIRLPSEDTTVASVAVVPVGQDVPLTEFSMRLMAALSDIGPTLHLNSARVDDLLDARGMAQAPQDSPDNVRLSVWLDEQETQARFVLYEADRRASQWTKRCIRQADQIILLARATANPDLGQIEQAWLGPERRITTAHQSLVLLHPDGGRKPYGTGQWLAERQVSRHHHLCWDSDSDFERLARFLTGRAVGLVLGGGGARGFAHIGVIRALQQAGVPIDMVGGTSMGAIVAAQHAQGWDYETILQLHRKTWMSIKTVRATTLPLVSIVSSRKFDHVLRTVCGDAYIENLWVNYFSVSANLATAEMVIHQSGPVWKAARASSSVPGMVPPVLEGHNLLVDGGVLDNLPANTMKTLCGGKVIAVNVSPSQDQNFTLDDSYHRMPSPLELVRSNFNPFQKTLVVPNIVNLMMRTTMLSSVHKANQVKEDVDMYFRPPVDRFGLVEYESFDAIVQVGYEYAARQIEAWNKEKSFKW